MEKEEKRQNNIKKEIKKSIIIIGICLLLSVGMILAALYMYPEPTIQTAASKPIIYLYPTEEKEVTVKLRYPDKITTSYPKYIDDDGWTVIARPDGTLTDTKTGRNLYSLYWEGKSDIDINKSEGFIVKGEDTASFLEEKLAILGLTEREAEEFIVYWLPKLEANKYNFIRFETMEKINEDMPLEITPKPDTLIRVWMEYKGLDKEIKVKEQILETPERKGFVAVEWGGSEFK